MIREILRASAIPSMPARYPDPPPLHAIYFDSLDTDGADGEPSAIFAHNCTVELYAPDTDAGAAALKRLTAQLDACGIHYTTQGWYWLASIQRYQEVIEFTYIEK